MSKINVEFFEQPIRKHYTELEPGVDVLDIEYGTYDNYVKVVFESCGYESEDSRWWRTCGRYVSNGAEFEGYTLVYNDKGQDYKVVGKVIKNEID